MSLRTPQHHEGCHRGKLSDGKTPEELRVHQTGVLSRLPDWLVVVLKVRWVLAA